MRKTTSNFFHESYIGGFGPVIFFQNTATEYENQLLLHVDVYFVKQ